MSVKGWTVYILDFVLMLAFVLFLADAVAGHILTTLPPWQGSAAVAATAAFVASLVRDLWPNPKPKPAAAAQEATS